ncbi:MAG: hypothetical protein L0338_37490 [Acidobacteria bacterium]|nr:hypothetical protein [Acidobacteriota bacterium]
MENPEDRSWAVDIPGQPVGSEITYYFAFSYPGGSQVKHPQRAPQVRYRFRVLPLVLKSASVPLRPPVRAAVRVVITVEATAPLKGSLYYRIGRGEFVAQLPLQIRAQSAMTQEAVANIPALPAGTVVDLYFEVSPQGGNPERIPHDAPARFYSYKVGSPKVRSLTGGGQVSALAASGHRVLVGLAGGGLIEVQPESAAPIRYTVANGLSSNDVRAVAVDPVRGISYVGSLNGVLAIRDRGDGFEPIAWPVFQRETDPLWSQISLKHAGTLMIVSALDGSALLQLESTEEQFEEEERETALLLLVADDEPKRLNLTNGETQAIGLTSGFFDEAEGCFLLGALAREADGEPWPAIVRLCGRQTEIFPVKSLPFSESAIPFLIEDIARTPGSGEVVVSVRYLVSRARARLQASGVFTFRDGSLSPLSRDLVALTPAVTVLLGDERRNRLLVGTDGQGLAIFEGGVVRHVNKTHGLPSEQITALASVENDEGIWVGTRDGLAQLKGNQATTVYPQVFVTGPIQPDLVPLDQNEAGDLLVGSATGGFAVLGEQGNRHGEIIRSFAVGREIPYQGLCGEAVFDPQRRAIFAVHLRQGLLRFDDNTVQLLTTRDGLKRTGIWHLLRHPKSGLLWLIYPPYPFRGPSGGGIQFYDGSSGGTFVPLPDQTVATIGDLLYVPERGTVFTAGAVGVLEFYENGRFERRSVNLVSGIDRNSRTGEIVVVGTAIERWDGRRFQPVLFRVNHPRLPAGKFYLRPARDIAIDTRGDWHVLFPGGYLLTMDAQGNVKRLLDYEDGVPRSSRKLLYHAASSSLAVGTESEGMIFIKDR